MIGIVNAHMFGTPTEPGEHVDWSTPDVDTAPGWADLLGETVEEFAAGNPHMIVFECLPPKCPGCRNSLVSHEPGSPECEEARHERAIAQSD